MKDLIYREDAIEAVEHVTLDAYGCGVEEAPAIEYRAVAALQHLPSARYASYEKRIPVIPLLMDSLECTCGSKKVYHSRVEIGVDTTVEELYCPECGIIMRAPHGMLDMLMKNWRDVHMKEAPANKPLTFHEAKLLNINEEPLFVECNFGERWGSVPPLNCWIVGLAWFRKWRAPEDAPSGWIEECYGKEWRCWTKKPTNEERKAAPWEN